MFDLTKQAAISKNRTLHRSRLGAVSNTTQRSPATSDI